MRDYTGQNPEFLIEDELITPAGLKDNRWPPLEGSFYSGSVKLKRFDTGAPFTDVVFKGLDTTVQIHTDPTASPVYMYMEFPNGIPTDLLLEYQAVDLTHDPATESLNVLLSNLAAIDETYYEEDIVGRPDTLPARKHRHAISGNSAALIAGALQALRQEDPGDLEEKYKDALAVYLPRESDKLVVDETQIALAINQLHRLYQDLLSRVQQLLPETVNELPTTAKLYIGAVNEVAEAINTAAAGSDAQLDLYGYIEGDTDLNRLMSGSSKIWLVQKAASVRGEYQDGETAKNLNLGDTIYYNNVTDKLYVAPMGATLAKKQDAVDESIVGDEKNVVTVVNSLGAKKDEVTAVGAPGYAGTVVGNSDLNGIPELSGSEDTFFTIAENATTIHGPWDDSAAFKVLSKDDAVLVDVSAGKLVPVKFADLKIPVQSEVDPKFKTDSKWLVGAINELYVLAKSVNVDDVTDFMGSLTADVTLTKPNTSALWNINGDVTVTVTVSDGVTEDKVLKKGSTLIYNKKDDLWIAQAVAVTGKQLIVEPRLEGDEKNVNNVLASIKRSADNLENPNADTFQGFINENTDITAECVGVPAKEWAVSVNSVVVTAPFDGSSNKVLNAGDIIKYANGVITLDTADNYNVGSAKAIEMGLSGDEKRPDHLVALAQAGGLGGGYETGEIFETLREVAPTEAIPLGVVPQSRTAYPKLFEAIGETYGKGDGSTTFGIPSKFKGVLKGKVYGTAPAPTTFFMPSGLPHTSKGVNNNAFFNHGSVIFTPYHIIITGRIQDHNQVTKDWEFVHDHQMNLISHTIVTIPGSGEESNFSLNAWHGDYIYGLVYRSGTAKWVIRNVETLAIVKTVDVDLPLEMTSSDVDVMSIHPDGETLTLTMSNNGGYDARHYNLVGQAMNLYNQYPGIGKAMLIAGNYPDADHRLFFGLADSDLDPEIFDNNVSRGNATVVMESGLPAVKINRMQWVEGDTYMFGGFLVDETQNKCIGLVEFDSTAKTLTVVKVIPTMTGVGFLHCIGALNKDNLVGVMFESVGSNLWVNLHTDRVGYSVQETTESADWLNYTEAYGLMQSVQYDEEGNLWVCGDHNTGSGDWTGYITPDGTEVPIISGSNHAGTAVGIWRMGDYMIAVPGYNTSRSDLYLKTIDMNSKTVKLEGTLTPTSMPVLVSSHPGSNDAWMMDGHSGNYAHKLSDAGIQAGLTRTENALRFPFSVLSFICGEDEDTFYLAYGSNSVGDIYKYSKSNDTAVKIGQVLAYPEFIGFDPTSRTLYMWIAVVAGRTYLAFNVDSGKITPLYQSHGNLETVNGQPAVMDESFVYNRIANRCEIVKVDGSGRMFISPNEQPTQFIKA